MHCTLGPLNPMHCNQWTNTAAEPVGRYCTASALEPGDQLDKVNCANSGFLLRILEQKGVWPAEKFNSKEGKGGTFLRRKNILSADKF